ncbi:MAG TPA: NfeD family protein, partial [Methylomirabilota bacterium]|nr:NfeD family protein [Methylomirabilota bacterium]
MMLVDSPVPELRVNAWRLLPAVLVMAGGTTQLVRMVIQAQRRRPVTGVEGMMGVRATADSDLDPDGWVIVQGERWKAVAEERIGRGELLRVVSVKGLELRVRRGA